MKRTCIALVVAVVLGGFAVSNSVVSSVSVWAQEAEEVTRHVVGAFYSRDFQAFYNMPIEVDSVGKLKSARRIQEVRELYAVPDYYGKLIEITQHGDRAVFWYLDEQGEIRNVAFDQVDETLMRIERRKVTKLRFEAVK